jgi:hypothetical protein
MTKRQDESVLENCPAAACRKSEFQKKTDARLMEKTSAPSGMPLEGIFSWNK